MKGVMEQIRDRLAAGETTGAAIALGYRPGAVYRAHQQLKHQRAGASRDLTQGAGPALASSPPARAQLEARIDQLEQEQTRLLDDLMDAQRLGVTFTRQS